MSKLIISVSGLRGIVGDNLFPEIVVRYVAAFCRHLPPGDVVVTRDGRATGKMIAEIVRGTLNAAGRNVIDADVAATPTTGILVRQFGAAGGIQISASHNPAEYNGMKLFGDDGRVVSADRGREVLKLYEEGSDPWRTHEGVGRVERRVDSLSFHERLIKETVDCDRIRARGFHILLDANHGAGGRLGVSLLEQLGCRVTLVGGAADGQFEHPPEPTAENLRSIGELVVHSGADAGFCQDPDADRLALIDADGRYVGEEYTLAVCLRHVLEQQPGPVVTNCATSRMAADLAARYGVPFHLSAVGEANVADVMIREKSVFGGEGNGGPIDPRVGYVRDSFVGMAQVLDALAARQASLAELVDELPRYAIVKTKVPVSGDDLAHSLARLEAQMADARADRQDGLRLDWDDRWLLVRASNTEPIVRLIAEARDRATADSLCRQAGEILAAS